jgi:REP element-mobilizing transposase RayT
MANTLGRGYQALRRGRCSASGSEYFLTICTSARQRGLASHELYKSIFSQARQLETEQHWLFHTGVVMPDHVHLLVTLGRPGTLSQAVRLFKGRLTPSLRFHSLNWERGFFDHRLRSTESRAPVFAYIYFNPTRAALVAPGEAWPGYYCCPGDWEWFGPTISTLDIAKYPNGVSTGFIAG